MSTVTAYAATSATDPLAKTTITRRDVGPHDVKFDIHFAGICHSDIHTVRGEWGPVEYPMVPGHEIAGVVTEVGPDVTKYKVGDRVGVGCFVDSCRECPSCKAGLEQYCTNPGMVGTYNGVGRDGEPTQGGYSGSIVVDENYVLRIPDSSRWMPRRRCCAPASPCTRHCGTGMRVRASKIAVIGLGGLGHVGVKLAKAMGAHVTVLSQSLKKMEDGLRLGADEYYATSDPDTFKKLRRHLRSDPQHGVGQPRPRRLPRPAGAGRHAGRARHARTPDGACRLPALIFGRRSLSGSLIGGIAETQEMLDFCAEHGVTPEIEVIAPDYINEAYERVLASDVRYRFVIDTESLRGA